MRNLDPSYYTLLVDINFWYINISFKIIYMPLVLVSHVVYQ